MAAVAPLLDIELIELDRANCCGAGVIAEHNQELADTLNARTFALAQQTDGELMMNICSTCQGAQTECQERLDANAVYRAHVNGTLAAEGLRYEAGITNKNFLWLLVEEIGLDDAAPEGHAARSPTCASARSTAATSCARRRALESTTSSPRHTYLGAGDRRPRRHRDRLRRLAQVLRLPDHHDEQDGVATPGGPPPRRRCRCRRRLRRDAVPAVPPQPRPPAAARRGLVGRELKHAGAPPAPARRARARRSRRRSSASAATSSGRRR